MLQQETEGKAVCMVSLFHFIIFLFYYFTLFDFIYLLEQVSTSRQRGRRRGRNTHYWAGSQMLGSISGPWNYDPSQRQTLNQPSHPDAPGFIIKKKKILKVFISGVTIWVFINLVRRWVDVLFCLMNFFILKTEWFHMGLFIYCFSIPQKYFF